MNDEDKLYAVMWACGTAVLLGIIAGITFYNSYDQKLVNESLARGIDPLGVACAYEQSAVPCTALTVKR